MLENDRERYVYLFRGLANTKEGRIGAWWSTNPYYALRFAQGGTGSLYMAKVPMSALNTAIDVSTENEYSNYFFNTDPPDARLVPPEKIKELQSYMVASNGLIGGTLQRPPTNPVEIGRKVFGGASLG